MFQCMTNLDEISLYGTLKFDNQYLSFRNGILILKDLSFKEISPQYFVPHKESFHGDPNVEHPVFDNFLLRLYRPSKFTKKCYVCHNIPENISKLFPTHFWSWFNW